MRQAAMTLAVATAAAPDLPSVGLQPNWEKGGQGVWAVSSLAMAALHAGALAAAVLWHPHFEHAPPPPAAMMIELAPMAAPAAPPTEKAPGVEQQAARPVEKKVEELPKPEPVVKKAEVQLPKPKPKPVVKKVEEEVPPAEKAVEQTTAPVAAEAPRAPAMAAPAPGASSAPPSNAIPSWQGALRAHLERHKRYPSAAQFRRQEGVAVVRFTMTRDGMVTAVRLERESGHGRLDDEALALLQRAQPLPAMPPEMAGDQVELVVPIQFFLK